MTENVNKSGEPHDRLTLLCDEMADPVKRPENEDVKAIIMLQDEDKGGIVIQGYELDETGGSNEAMVDLVMHLTAIFKAHGKKLILAPIQQSRPDAN